MRPSVPVGVCVSLCLCFAGWSARKGTEFAFANESLTRTPSLEEAYAGWTREQMVEALEQRKSVALVRKDALLDQHIEQGDFEERFEPGQQSQSPTQVAARPDAVALRVDTTPSGEGLIVRTTIVERGEDSELDRLVDEIRWLTTQTGTSMDE